jgi:hypothetical protein
LLSSATVLGVSAIRPNAKPEISIAAPSTIANNRCDLVIGYPPSREANKNGDPEKAQQTRRHDQSFAPHLDKSRYFFNMRASSLELRRPLMPLFFSHIG